MSNLDKLENMTDEELDALSFSDRQKLYDLASSEISEDAGHVEN